MSNIWFLSSDANLMEIDQTYAATVQPKNPTDIIVVEKSAYDALQSRLDVAMSALKAKLEAIPQGFVLVRCDKDVHHAFDEISRDRKEYAFLFAPLNWDGKWEKVHPDILKHALKLIQGAGE